MNAAALPWVALLALLCSSCKLRPDGDAPSTRRALRRDALRVDLSRQHGPAPLRPSQQAERSYRLPGQIPHRTQRELEIPRTFPRGDQSEAIFTEGLQSVPRYRQKLADLSFVRTEIWANGKEKRERRYLVASNLAIPHGTWKRFNDNGDPVSETEYRNGTIRGRHWVNLRRTDSGADAIETFWRGKTPVGTWTINPGNPAHTVIHFEDGHEVLKEHYGAIRGEKTLLWQWKNGRENFKADWVVGKPPHLARGTNYLKEPVHSRVPSAGLVHQRTLPSPRPRLTHRLPQRLHPFGIDRVIKHPIDLERGGHDHSVGPL